MLKKYLILILFLAVIVFLITYFNKDINNLDGALNDKNINYILNYLDFEYESYKYNVNEITFETNYKNPKEFEYTSVILFKLINDLNVVRFNHDSLVYKYYFDDINTLFNYKLKEKTLFELKSSYSNLKSDMYYIGNLKGIYRMYAPNDQCSADNLLKEDSSYKYYIICYLKDDILILDSKYNRLTIDSLLDRNIVNIDDLNFYNLHLKKVGIDENISE